MGSSVGRFAAATPAAAALPPQPPTPQLPLLHPPALQPLPVPTLQSHGIPVLGQTAPAAAERLAACPFTACPLALLPWSNGKPLLAAIASSV